MSWNGKFYPWINEMMKLVWLTWEIQNRILPRPTRSHAKSIHLYKTTPCAIDLWYFSPLPATPAKNKQNHNRNQWQIQLIYNWILTVLPCVGIHVRLPDDSPTVEILGDGNFGNVAFDWIPYTLKISTIYLFFWAICFCFWWIFVYFLH